MRELFLQFVSPTDTMGSVESLSSIRHPFLHPHQLCLTATQCQASWGSTPWPPPTSHLSPYLKAWTHMLMSVHLVLEVEVLLHLDDVDDVMLLVRLEQL